MKRRFGAIALLAASELTAQLAVGQQTTQQQTTTAMPPKPGVIQTFKDWVVGCDNGLICAAVAVFPDGQEVEGEFEFVITRGPGPADAPSLRFNLDAEKQRPGPIDVRLDGRVLAKGERSTNGERSASVLVLMGNDALAVARALAQGQRIEARQGKVVLAQPSLAGAAAALRYMDAQQSRVGGVTALVARGAKPAAEVPQAPALPKIRAAVPRAATAKAEVADLQGGELARALKVGCIGDNEMLPENLGPDNVLSSLIVLHPLDAQRTLLLLPCGNGPYQSWSAVLIARGEPGSRQFTPAVFDDKDPDPQAPADAPRVLVEAQWDESTAWLSSHSRGRGPGDCGSGSTYVWDGGRFRLFESTSMPECRGSYEQITTWRAELAR